MLLVTDRNLKKSLQRASSYEEWREAAEHYDKRNKLDVWRRKDHSGQYDNVSIRRRLGRLRELKARHDTRGLLFNLNEGIHGNVGGMGRSSLYSHAMSGTKKLIEEYIEEIVHALELLAEEDSGEISPAEKLDFFRRANHCFGRSAFMMSGSGSMLFFHVGVVKALVRENLLPDILSGSSGGALVGCIVSTHTDSELMDLLCPEYFLERLPEARGGPTAPASDEMAEGIANYIPDLTFQQAFEKSGRAMNVSIAAAETHQTSRLLNAAASPSVLMRSAALASAAVPGVFPPVTLMALDDHGDQVEYLPSRKWVDGSVSDDLPAKRLARLYGVNHYIVSQTNPHVIPFASDARKKQTSLDFLKQAARRSTREWLNALTAIADQADRKNGKVTRATSLIRSVLNQDYFGDINILPDYKFQNPLTMIRFPGEKVMQRLIDSGERCTWPKLEMIRQQTRISRRLTEILQDFDQWQDR